MSGAATIFAQQALPSRCTPREALSCSGRAAASAPVALRIPERQDGAACSFAAPHTSRRASRRGSQVCHARSDKASTDIQLVCLDVDGTLLNSQSQLTPAVEEAIKACREAGVQVILATGKAPVGPWMEALEAKLGKLPGAYMLGLVLHGAQGETTHTRSLESDFASDIFAVGKRFKLTTVAYCNEHLYIQADSHAESFRRSGEPEPQRIQDLNQVLKMYDVQKVVFCGDDAHLRELRPRIAEALTSRTPSGRMGSGGGYAQSGEVVTMSMSLSDQLQLLPPGQTKAVGVGRLLKQLGVKPEQMLAIGDSESDVSTLQLAGLAVAMGNASQEVKDVAHEHTGTQDEDGVAAAIKKFVLQPRGL